MIYHSKTICMHEHPHSQPHRHQWGNIGRVYNAPLFCTKCVKSWFQEGMLTSRTSWRGMLQELLQDTAGSENTQTHARWHEHRCTHKYLYKHTHTHTITHPACNTTDTTDVH